MASSLWKNTYAFIIIESLPNVVIQFVILELWNDLVFFLMVKLDDSCLMSTNFCVTYDLIHSDLLLVNL